jgi:type II secretory pathway pseudopilin PulG
MRAISRKRGITLVEVLIAIAVILVLVLLVPVAIQQARENSRRAQCANNMKQIGLALLDYESHQKHLPGSAEIIKSDPQRPVGGWSFLFKILPNMEYDTIYNSINPDDIKKSTVATGTRTNPRTSDGNANVGNGPGLHAISVARDTGIAEFLCPSDWNQSYEDPCASSTSTTGGVKIAVTTYKAMCSAFYPGFATNSGKHQQYTGAANVPAGEYSGFYECDGGLYPTNDGIRTADLSDGASCTIMCAETTDFRASSWIAGTDVNMIAIPIANPPQSKVTISAGTVRKPDSPGFSASYFALPGFNGSYYSAGGTSNIITFFSPLEYGVSKAVPGVPAGGKGNGVIVPGKDAGAYPLDPTAVPCQTGFRTRWFNPKLIYGPSSGHPTVINCLFGDGSVRGVRKDVDAQALFQAVTRSNHDPNANNEL